MTGDGEQQRFPEQGYKGEGKQFPTALKNVRLIASNLGRNVVVSIVVLKDSPIKSIHDLKGRRIVTGDRGWGTTELAEAFMATAGMAPDKFKADGGTISYTSITDRWPEILISGGTAALGIVCLAAALQGWLRCRATLLHRALLLAAGFLFVLPRVAADVAGLVLLALVYGLQSLRRVPEITPAPAASLD